MASDQSMKLRVFLSWSGERSRAAAQALRDWLPSVLQNVKPYFTPDDIEKGARWSNEIRVQLESSDFGIICLTPENVSAPWILFEAGALSKLEKSRVAPLLLDIDPAEVTGPLGQLQLTRLNREEVLKLTRVLNRALGESGLDEPTLLKVFERWWEDLEKDLQNAAALPTSGPTPKKRSERAMLEEVLVRVRNVEQMFEVRSPASFFLTDKANLTNAPRAAPDMSIAELPLAPRYIHALISHGVKSVDDLLQMSAIDLLKIPNLGKRAQIEIVEILARSGLEMKPIART